MWRFSERLTRFPLENPGILKEDPLKKRISTFFDEETKNSALISGDFVRKPGFLQGSFREICSMDFPTFKNHIFLQEKALERSENLVLLGVKARFQRSLQEFKALKLITELSSSQKTH